MRKIVILHPAFRIKSSLPLIFSPKFSPECFEDYIGILQVAGSNPAGTSPRGTSLSSAW
jgi:hypothetical protein